MSLRLGTPSPSGLVQRTPDIQCRRLLKLTLTQALERIERLQVKIEISPPVLTYHRAGKRVQLVDRSFLFYRKYGAQSWPWDEGDEIQNDLAGATPLDIFAD